MVSGIIFGARASSTAKFQVKKETDWNGNLSIVTQSPPPNIYNLLGWQESQKARFFLTAEKTTYGCLHLGLPPVDSPRQRPRRSTRIKKINKLYNNFEVQYHFIQLLVCARLKCL